MSASFRRCTTPGASSATWSRIQHCEVSAPIWRAYLLLQRLLRRRSPTRVRADWSHSSWSLVADAQYADHDAADLRNTPTPPHTFVAGHRCAVRAIEAGVLQVNE